MAATILPFRKRKPTRTKLLRSVDRIPAHYELISQTEAINGLGRAGHLLESLAKSALKDGRTYQARLLRSCRREVLEAGDHISGSLNIERIEKVAARWRAIGLSAMLEFGRAADEATPILTLVA